jgi:branched-chain amino acid transport system substrate-binding protein
MKKDKPGQGLGLGFPSSLIPHPSSLLLVLVLLLANSGCGSKATPEPILVGQVVSLSGPDRMAGEHARQGVQLALDDPRDERRVGGRRVAVLHADDRSEDELAQSEAVRLLSINKVVALLGGTRVGAAERLARTAQTYGVPAVLPTEVPGPARGDMVFSLAVDPARRGRLLARYLGRQPTARVLVFTDERDPVAVALVRAFVQEAHKNKAPLVKERSLGAAADAADHQAQVEWKPDAILLACPPRSVGKLREQLGFTGLVAYGGPDASASDVRSGGPVLLATVFANVGLSERGREFARRYEERFREPPDLYAAQAHDSACLLLDALQQTPSAAGPALRDHLNKVTNFETVTGPMNFKDRLPLRKVFLLTVDATGGEKLLETLEGTVED